MYELEESNNQWIARNSCGVEDRFDCVFLSQPVPQILQIKGIEKYLEKSSIDKLKSVVYSSRYALCIALPAGLEPPVPWSVKYITDNSCIRFISIDTRKRSQGEPHSILVHTSVPYGLEHLEEDKNNMSSKILPHLRKELPWLPAENLLELKCHKWRYSQVIEGVEGAPGCMVVNESPLLILAGDAFVHSNLDGCIESALAATQKFAASIRCSS